MASIKKSGRVALAELKFAKTDEEREILYGHIWRELNAYHLLLHKLRITKTKNGLGKISFKNGKDAIYESQDKDYNILAQELAITE